LRQTRNSMPFGKGDFCFGLGQNGFMCVTFRAGG
jgi:hypothetical protein